MTALSSGGNQRFRLEDGAQLKYMYKSNIRLDNVKQSMVQEVFIPFLAASKLQPLDSDRFSHFF